jgi:hypothetical protein
MAYEKQESLVVESSGPRVMADARLEKERSLPVAAGTAVGCVVVWASCREVVACCCWLGKFRNDELNATAILLVVERSLLLLDASTDSARVGNTLMQYAATLLPSPDSKLGPCQTSSRSLFLSSVYESDQL